jgi:peptidoglycan/xylan/chitin deacetylase (PgdA/CDA1 family)
MATEPRRQPAGPDRIRQHRRLRREQGRRRAAIRRRNALFCAAIASAVVGAVVGSAASGGSAAEHVVKLSRGGLGPPIGEGRLVHTKAPVPILIYHVIANPPASAQLPELFVDPDTFERQMEWLKGNGYAAVTLTQLYDAWYRDARLPERPVVLTFDDGYRGDYVYARRTLMRLHWPGDLNLLVGNIGDELSDRMIEQLIDDGWELDAHTISHLDLTRTRGAQLTREVTGSREILKGRFHQPVNFFCYPAGKFNQATVQAVRTAGYLGATTELPGEASRDDMYKLHRIRVDGSDGVSGLEQKLSDTGT